MKTTKLTSIVVIAACLLSVGTLTAQEQAGDDTAAKQASQTPGISIERVRQNSTRLFNFLNVQEDTALTIGELTMRTGDTRQFDRRRAAALPRAFPFGNPNDIDEFEVSDTDGNGTLSKEEFDQRARSVRMHMLQAAFDKIDADSDGRVELEEFNARVDKLAKLDKNGDGMIGRTEATREEWREMARVPGFDRSNRRLWTSGNESTSEEAGSEQSEEQ